MPDLAIPRATSPLPSYADQAALEGLPAGLGDPSRRQGSGERTVREGHRPFPLKSHVTGRDKLAEGCPVCRIHSFLTSNNLEGTLSQSLVSSFFSSSLVLTLALPYPLQKLLLDAPQCASRRSRAPRRTSSCPFLPLFPSPLLDLVRHQGGSSPPDCAPPFGVRSSRYDGGHRSVLVPEREEVRGCLGARFAGGPTYIPLRSRTILMLLLSNPATCESERKIASRAYISRSDALGLENRLFDVRLC